MHGEVRTRHVQTSNKGGRPGTAYYLNEGQALVLCALSRTAVASQIRKALIDVFRAYRDGQLVHVKEHRRRRPGHVSSESDFRAVRDCLLAFRSNPVALIDVIARCVVRLDRLEAGV